MKTSKNGIEDLIVTVNDFCCSSDKIIELSRDVLCSPKENCNLWTCKYGEKEFIDDINSIYIEIIKCISLLEHLAQIYANKLKYLNKYSNSPWDPRCTKTKSSPGCSFLDPQC